MSGYAPNPKSPVSEPASLTSSLLARKGQASPAVDHAAHEGVDMDLYSAHPAPRRRPRVSEDAIETLYPENPTPEDRARMRRKLRRAAAKAKANGPFRRRVRPDAAPDAAPHDGADPAPAPVREAVQERLQPAEPASPRAPAPGFEPAPANWTIVQTHPPLRPRLLPSPAAASPASRSEPVAAKLRATVRFRMPASDLVRLRFASRDLKESCQTIILDAIASYLDANDVPLVDDETAAHEAARMAGWRPGPASA